MVAVQSTSYTTQPTTVGCISMRPNSRLRLTPYAPSPLFRVLLSDESMWHERNEQEQIVWEAAASLEALRWLEENLRAKLTVDDEVCAWVRDICTIPTEPSFRETPLYGYQKEAVRFLIHRRRAMLALSPGLGKTLVSAIAADTLSFERITVVAPKSLLYMWRSELLKWQAYMRRKPVVEVWHHKAQDVVDPGKILQTEGYWWVVNPEMVVRNLDVFLRHKPQLLILDESTYYKNRQAERTKILSRLSRSVPVVWCLTGSPAMRMLDDMWSQLHLLDPKAYSSYWRFAKEYCIVENTPWGNKVMANKPGAEETIKRRFADIYFARSQDEVLDIPSWLFEEIDCRMTKTQEAAYDKMRRELAVELEGENGTTVVRSPSHLAKVVHLLQLASNTALLGGRDDSGKWDVLYDLFDLYPGPYLVWVNYIQSAKLLLENIKRKKKLKTGLMLGETSAQDRQKLVDTFQAGGLDVLIVGQAVGSFGLTLTSARTAFYVERNFDGNYFQSLHRFRRIGTQHRPHVVHLHSILRDGGPTIDHTVHGMLDYRVAMIKALTVGMLREIL